MSGPAPHAAVVDRIMHGARWAAMLRLLAQSISWLCTLVVVRYISTTDYGLNAMLEAPLELMFLLSTVGLDLALVRSRSVGPEVLRPAFGWLLLVNALLFCAYFFGSTALAAYFNEPRLAPLAQALAFIFLLVPFRAIPNAILDRELKFKLRAGIELVTSIVAALAAMAMAIAGLGVWALVGGVLINRVLGAVLLMFHQPWFVVPSLRFAEVRGLLVAGGTLTFASGLAITANMMPIVVGGPLLGPAQIGLYSVALQFAMLPLSKVMPIVNSIAFPAFAKFEGQPEAIGRYATLCLGTGALALFPVMVGLACASQAFALGVLGPNWEGAAIPLAVLALVMPARGIALFLRQVMNGVGRADLTLVCTAVVWLTCLGMVLAAAPSGLYGLVTAFAVTEVVGLLVTCALAARAMSLPLRESLAAFRAPVLATTGMALAALACRFAAPQLAPLAMLLLQVVAGGLVYLGLLRLFFWEDARRLITLFRPGSRGAKGGKPQSP